jgi:hypothetical protein
MQKKRSLLEKSLRPGKSAPRKRSLIVEHKLSEPMAREEPFVPSSEPFILNVYVVETLQMNNVNVTGSQVGVVNAGGSINTVGDISITVTSLKEQGKEALADAFASLTNSLSECGASDKEKADLLQNMKLLSEEAIKPEQDRNTSLIGFALSHFDKILPTIEGVGKVWDSCKEIVQSLGN